MSSVLHVALNSGEAQDNVKKIIDSLEQVSSRARVILSCSFTREFGFFGPRVPPKRRCRTVTLSCSLVYVVQHSGPEQSIRSGLVAPAMLPKPEDHIGVEPKC
jgi:hypothetical protein